MRVSTTALLAAVAGIFTVAGAAHAQVVFSEDFNTDVSGNWTVNAAAGNNLATFAFDYSSVGIPAAPNSADGSTLGLKLEANYPGGPAAAAFTGLSVSPTGQSFTGDFTLTADVWLNFNGPFPTGGPGSTQAGGLGVLTAGTTPQWAGGVQDSVWFATTGDGQSSVDYRAYSPAASTGYVDSSGVFAAGTTGSPRNNTNAYYAGFGGVGAPAAQVALHPGQTGTTAVGSQGMAWHEYVVNKSGDIVTWSIDGLLIATVDTSTISGLGGDNISLNYFDTSSSVTDAAGRPVLFGLFDNVQVVVPEPTSLGLLGVGALGMLRRRRA